MTSTPNIVSEALAFMRQEHKHPSQSWERMCLGLVRTALGQDVGKYRTAFIQWENTPANRKHVGGDPKDAPVGAALFYKGSNPAGHVMLKTFPFANGHPAAWSNDLVEAGKVNKVSVYAPIKVWGQKYLGYTTSINDKDIVKLIGH